MLAISNRCPPDLSRKSQWCLHDFVLVKRLGVGGASAVYQAVSRNTGFGVALKLYFKRKMTLLNVHQVHREVRIHICLDHPNIVDLWGAFEDEDHVVLVIDYAAKGDLFDMLRHTGGRMKESDVVTRIMYPFMSGLWYLHSMNVIHRDIKLENTLFAADGTLKIADFGLSIDSSQERPVTRLGTLDYMSPEVLVCPDKRLPEENKELSHLTYTNKVDAWACGVLAYELLVGCPPFGMSTRDGSVKAIMCQQPKIPHWLPHAAADFILWALTKQAAHRPSVHELMQHSWITSHLIASIPFLPLKYLTPHPHMPTALHGAYASIGHHQTQDGLSSVEPSPLLLPPAVRSAGHAVQHDLSACSMQSSNTDFAQPYTDASPSQVDHHMYSPGAWPALNIQDMMVPIGSVPVGGQAVNHQHPSRLEHDSLLGLHIPDATMRRGLQNHISPHTRNGRVVEVGGGGGTYNAASADHCAPDSAAHLASPTEAAQPGPTGVAPDPDLQAQDFLLSYFFQNGSAAPVLQNPELQPLAASADRMFAQATANAYTAGNARGSELDALQGSVFTQPKQEVGGGMAHTPRAAFNEAVTAPEQQLRAGRSSMQANRVARRGAGPQLRDSALIRCASACVRMPHTSARADQMRPDEMHRSYWEASGMGFKPMGVWDDGSPSPQQPSPAQSPSVPWAPDFTPAGVYAMSDALEHNCSVKPVEHDAPALAQLLFPGKPAKRNLATRAEPWQSSGSFHASMHSSSSSAQLQQDGLNAAAYACGGRGGGRHGPLARPKSAMLAVHPHMGFGYEGSLASMHNMPILEHAADGDAEAAAAVHAMMHAEPQHSMDVLSCSPSFLRPVKRPLFRQPVASEGVSPLGE